MDASRRGLAVAVVVAGACAALCAGVAGAAGAPTWQLLDYHQSACFSPRVTDTYYGIWIKGRWTRAIDVGAEALPPGGSYSTTYAPIRPGSSDGVGSLAYVRVQIPTTTPIGTYTANLWATDGRSRQTVPVTLVVKARCGRY